MQIVLGIDAAWTAHQPSGLALATCNKGRWSLAGVWPSYDAFLGRPIERSADLPGRVQQLCGRLPDLIAVDMPLSDLPITGRRAADRAVSMACGGRKAATHSPSALRPGVLADRLRCELAEVGYALRHRGRPQGRLAEVYPHPALIELTDAFERLPYKLHRSPSYWPALAPAARRARLRDTWLHILQKLESLLPGTMAQLPPPILEGSVAALKSFEDQLDAIICAAVAVEILEGRAMPFGDDTAAIWIPSPRSAPARSSV